MTHDTDVKIGLKTTHEMKRLLELAAFEAGLCLNTYIINASIARAGIVKSNRQYIRLNDPAWTSLNRAITYPESATFALKQLLKSQDD